jgi:spoIIIJ-associated protein
VAEQAEIVREFLAGLVDAFGLEGEVKTRVEGDIIYAEVTGDQTEALVGPKGVILDAVMELCRTMVHRHSQAGARLRLDIAGYAERRREALRIYARRLAEKVVADGGEVMLEPMNPADRKVVHDTVADIDGVRSFSEGEDPERSVVIAPDDEAEEDGD